ncbi:hypothetical protein V5799_015680 [Amblyomma americanum]|uniref:Uncharacterized protein n=1 Tax=Amblyomma americanum TaxID=6943 RepID=A0AAQ4F766_AMBAM
MQVTSQKEKKAQKRKLSTKSCALQLKSCSSDEELIEKGALDAKPKEIEKLQFEIRSLRKKLAEEWKRNHDLQEVVVTGIGEVQEHLKKRRMCQCSEQQQVCNLDQGLPVQVQISVPTVSDVAQEQQEVPRGDVQNDVQNGGKEDKEVQNGDFHFYSKLY